MQFSSITISKKQPDKTLYKMLSSVVATILKVYDLNTPRALRTPRLSFPRSIRRRISDCDQFVRPSVRFLTSPKAMKFLTFFFILSQRLHFQVSSVCPSMPYSFGVLQKEEDGGNSFFTPNTSSSSKPGRRGRERGREGARRGRRRATTGVRRGRDGVW